MLSVIVLFIVSLLPFITTWITSPEELFFDNGSRPKRFKPIFERKLTWRLTRKGWAFLSIAALTILLAWSQYRDNEKEKSRLRLELATRDSINRNELRIRDQVARNEQYSRDSLNNEKIRKRDSLSYIAIFLRDSNATIHVEKSKNETIAELAKYGLKYDSSQRLIARLVRDSSRKTIISNPEPEFALCIPPIKIDSSKKELRLSVNLCVKKAACRVLKTHTYLVTQNKNLGYNFQGKFEFIPNNLFLMPDTESNFSGILLQDKEFTTAYLVFDCDYSNNDGSKIYRYREIAVYDLKEKTVGFGTLYRNAKVEETLRSNGIIIN